MTTIERYVQGYESYVSPDSEPADQQHFHRSWAGVVAARGYSSYSEMPERERWLFYNPICWVEWQRLLVEQQWPAIVAQLQEQVDKWTPPEEPRSWYFSEIAPPEPTERDARAYFNREFKRAYPGERANSKHANAAYLEVIRDGGAFGHETRQQRAMRVLRHQWTTAVATYEQRKAEHESRCLTLRQEWLDKIHTQALFEEFVRSLRA